MHDNISKNVITSVAVVIGLLVILTLIGIYYKIDKKRRALARIKDAETKWREVYGHRQEQEQVMNPIAIEMNSAASNMAIETFFSRESDINMQTDVEISNSINNINNISNINSISTISNISTTSTASTPSTTTSITNNTASTQKPQTRPKVNALERKLKKKLVDD